MSTFDFSRLNPTQQDALANVAFGGEGAGCSPQTLAFLERRGLIQPCNLSKRDAPLLSFLLRVAP